MSEASAGAAASVNVLTAEVRTLMVGNRQVTMSVFRQLDHVVPAEIEPFGRVQVAGSSREITVVGRGVSSGALVRSSVKQAEPPHSWNRPVDVGLDAQWCVLGPHDMFSRPQFAVIAERGAYKATRLIPSGTPVDSSVPAGQWRYSNGEAEEVVKREAEYDLDTIQERVTLHAAWKALPLIVLAGLR
jgi:hypothetical protein